MKHIKKINEFTSATGGNLGAITGGEVYNIPVSGNSTLTPGAIQSNVGSVDMNHTMPNDIHPIEEQDPVIKKKVKSKIKKRLNKLKEETKEKPVMNWNEYVKRNVNKINNI